MHKRGLTLKAEKKSQLDRFKKAARDLGTDDDEGRFNEKLTRLAKRPLTVKADSESMDDEKQRR